VVSVRPLIIGFHGPRNFINACATHIRLLLISRSCRNTTTMMSDKSPVPQAPKISPSVAAALSVSSKLLPPHHYYCSRPITQQIPKCSEIWLTPTSAGCVCVYLRNTLLPVTSDTTVSNSHARCALLDTRQSACGDLLHLRLLYLDRSRTVSA
jgi:hypothetical protein